MTVYRKFDPATVLASFTTPVAKVANVANPTPTVATVARLADHIPLDGDVERVAIVAEGGAPDEWAKAFSDLHSLPCPAWLCPDRWQRIIEAAGTFLDRWARAAHALGWDSREAFGLHLTAGKWNYESTGFLESLVGLEVVALTREGMCIRFTDGGTRMIQRRNNEWIWA